MGQCLGRAQLQSPGQGGVLETRCIVNDQAAAQGQEEKELVPAEENLPAASGACCISLEDLLKQESRDDMELGRGTGKGTVMEITCENAPNNR